MMRPTQRRRNPKVVGYSYDSPNTVPEDEEIDSLGLQEAVESNIPALVPHYWGGGSYAQVWRVPNANLVFKATQDESEIAAQARLIRKGLSHPSIVDGYCVAESAFHNGLWFIATRFVDFESLPSDYWVWLRNNWIYLQDAAEDPDEEDYEYTGSARGQEKQERFQRWTDHLFDALRLLAVEGIRWRDMSRENIVLDLTTDLPVILDLGMSEVDGDPEEVPTMKPMEAYRCALRVAGHKTNPATTTAERTDPDLWEAVKREVTAGSKGGKPGQWSARKAQLAVALYKQRGGGYWGEKSPTNSLAKWTREKWRTKSGRPSLETGERYLPSRAIAALTDAEYRATTRAKRAGMRKGQQFVPQPEDVALKVRAYRRNRKK